MATTTLKEGSRKAAEAAAKNVDFSVKLRPQAGKGMYEVTTKNLPRGTFVLTSPRSVAFPKSTKG